MKYFIINNKSRAANYGVGTYINQLRNCLGGRDDIELLFIDMCAEVKEYILERDDDNNVHYKIPQIVQHYEDSLYCKNTFYFLSLHISPVNNEHYVFHFNYFQHYYLALCLKSYIPSCQIILSVHYFGWCFELNGNTTRFKEYIQQKKQIHFCEPNNNGHNASDINYDSDIRKDIINNYLHERRFLCLADNIIALSTYAQDLITSTYHIEASKVVVIYNGMIAPMPQLGQVFQKKSQVQNIVYVGRLDEIKGVRYLIKAFKKLYDSNHLLHLYLVGDGDFSNYLSEIDDFWEAVTFTGKIDKDKILQIYQKATIGVLPSFHEQCSYTAIEMMMLGIPFIGTDSTGLCEMLTATPDNIVHIDEKKFINDLSDKMNHLLNDNVYRSSSSKAMRETYFKRYSLDKMKHHLLNNVLNQEFTISNDMLEELDECMVSLINSRPDIDLCFYGMTGIGYYIWKRICILKQKKSKKDVARCFLLQEYMIYYLDWLTDSIKVTQTKGNQIKKILELQALLSELYADGFYCTVTSLIIKMILTTPNSNEHIDINTIYGNAIKIYAYHLN